MDALEPDDPGQVGRYRLIRRLGAGGMGRVFLGQSPSGRLVAVKLIRAELADDPGFRMRFAQEVAAARRVSGIYTAPVVDADPDGPQPWLVTAYVDGPSLADAVSAQGPMPAGSVRTLAAGLAEGLAAVHAAGVVHRDLKPSNVLLAGDGPHIIDFGISRATDSAWLTFAGGVMGSPGFMSPEQAEGRPVGPASDIFSLGGLLAYAATGESPFGVGPASALLYRVVYGSASTAAVPAPVRTLVERCLAKDPASRPTAEELLDELGYAEPDAGWRFWHAAAGRAPASPAAHRQVPATQQDPPPSAADPLADPLAGQDLVPWTGLQIPVPVRPGHPARHRRRSKSAVFVGLAVAAGLAVGSVSAAVGDAETRGDSATASAESGRAGELTSPASQPAEADRAAKHAAAAGPKVTALGARDWKRAWRRAARRPAS